MHLFAEFDAGWILPLIIWPWLAVSLFVYVRRWWRKRNPALATDSKDGPVAAEPRSGRVTTSTPSSASTASSTSTLRADESSGSMVEAVIREELEARRRAEAGEVEAADESAVPLGPATTGRTGLFASSPADDRPRTPVAEALSGMAWPCDLAPLVTGDTDDHHVVFLTKGVEPAIVGAALGDELERLGYALSSIDDTTVRATRDSTVVRVVLHPDGAAVRRDDAPVFPTATPRSVVVEFST